VKEEHIKRKKERRKETLPYQKERNSSISKKERKKVFHERAQWVRDSRACRQAKESSRH
jgi:hypothetical protein